MTYSNSVLDEIRRLHDQSQTGVLILNNGDGEHVDVFFREGLVEAVSSNLGSRRLGDYLSKEMSVPARDLDVVESEARRWKVAFGEAAVRKNLVNQSEIGVAARCQALDLIHYVIQGGFSVDSFTNCLRSYYVPARLSFPHIVLEFFRNSPSPYEPLPGSEVVLRDGFDLTAFPWYPEELCVLNELNYPSSFQRLLAATGLKESSVMRILGVLDRMGIIETTDSMETSAVVPRNEFAFENLIPVVTSAVLDERLAAARIDGSFTSEQLKNLKVQIGSIDTPDPLKVFTVSSPDAQDGKSFISANLAFSFAMDPGRRVIVIDCDLRSPSLQKYLGVPAEPGLIQYLCDSRLSPYCYVRRIENLYFLTAGGIAPNPIEILSMQRMRQLVEFLKRDFDTIILDAPPYCPIADARIVTGLSDRLIMVVRRGKTAYSSLERALKAIDRNRLLGVIFNDVKPMLFHTYHQFDYYNYGSRYVYAGSQRQKARAKNYLES